MSDSRRHRVDGATYYMGVFGTLMGVFTAPIALPASFFLVRDAGWAGGGFVLLLAVAALSCLIGGAWILLRIPTVGGWVVVDSEKVELTLRKGKLITIPWASVESWGLASRRVFRSKLLVLRPASGQTPPAGAGRLWRRREKGWLVEGVDPEADLLETLEEYAPRPREDR